MRNWARLFDYIKSILKLGMIIAISCGGNAQQLAALEMKH